MEIELIIVGLQRQEQIENRFHRFGGLGVVAVYRSECTWDLKPLAHF
jgi:hypothetical protein